MFLEKLAIQGFKSFAHKNKLEFSGLIDGQKRGLTAIVGPNGSGKSNVADAVRWALGEQSLKTLRGKKSEDVIFSGSDQKGQLSLAEVSLFLNNSEAAGKKQAQDPPGENEGNLDLIIRTCAEIVITRRLYRSGESEYLLNGNRVRLSDIQLLLAKANFGQKTYSVIGQGMVENFLSSSAAERKDFFDEATGVKQFQIKRDAALNKLESSYENLQQVEMLLAEIRPRLKSLTRQVEKLKRRGEIENDLRRHQLEYYGSLWQEINGRLEEMNTRLLASEKAKLEKERKLEKINAELDKIRATDNFREIAELQPRLKEIESGRHQLLKQISKLQAEMEIQLEAQGQFDVSWLNNKQAELSAALENTRREIASLLLPETEQTIARLEADIAPLARELAEMAKSQEEIVRLEEERARYQKQISKLEAVLEANLEVQGQFDVSWLNNKQEELRAENARIVKQIADLEASAQPAAREDLEKKLNAIQSRLSAGQTEISALNRRLQAASPGPDKRAGIGKLVDEFLQQLEKIMRENDLAQVRKLIEAAKKDFRRELDSLIGAGQPEELGRLQELQEEMMGLTEERQQVAEALNAERLRLASAEERLQLWREKSSQLSRELSDIRGKLEKAQTKFDARQLEEEKDECQKKILALENEIQSRHNQDRRAALEEKRRQLSASLQEARLSAAALAERRRLLENQERQMLAEISDIKNKLAKSERKFDSAAIEREQDALKERLAALESEAGELEDRLDSLNRAKEQEKAQMFDHQRAAQVLQQEINLLTGELNSWRVEAARQETRLEDLEANIRNDGLQLGEIKSYQAAAGQDWDRLHKQLAIFKNQLEQIGGIDPEAEKEYEETKERYDFLSQQTADLDQAIKSLEEVIAELDQNIKSRFDAEFKVISEKFNEYFQILFNGGSAKIFKLMVEDLEKEESARAGNGANPAISGLTPEENALKDEAAEKIKRLRNLRKYNAVGLAGIEIQATPPGKKIQTVTMLSGGERALTAIALICAIISANPSPFVVLDEVDAALDEANSERLAKILDDLSHKTQFIVITHNRACMRRASILYGVTMEADGVSKLLSVRLDDLPGNPH